MNVLTGPVLKNMLLEGYNRINKKVGYLNDINVFPVADGDTGINLYITMGKVVEELEKNGYDITIKQAAQSIAKGAFQGAKGNSGVILSQFFVGFTKYIENEESVSPQLFAEALIEGSNMAYKAVMHPREGTILTVFKETAEAALYKANSGAGWKETVEHCYEIAQKSTLETPNLLQDLKDAGVVDAGALGFVYLIQGWLFVIANNFSRPKALGIRSELEHLHNKGDVNTYNLDYQYCTEALISQVKSQKGIIKDLLLNFGSSLLLIREKDNLKLHIHSNTPVDVISKFSEFGELQSVRIDDMLDQMRRP